MASEIDMMGELYAPPIKLGQQAITATAPWDTTPAPSRFIAPPDNGCKLAAIMAGHPVKCLECPFPAGCMTEEGDDQLGCMERARLVVALAAKGVAQASISQLTGWSVRTVQRVISHHKKGYYEEYFKTGVIPHAIPPERDNKDGLR